MKSVFRMVPLLATAVVALGLALPAYAQDAMKLEATCGGDYKGNIKSIEAPDKYTFKMTLCNPDPAVPSKVAFSAFAIHSSDQLEATGGGGEALLDNPIGTGPYKLEKWDKGNEIVFTANENYWGDAPIKKTVILKWNSEAAARWNELQAGTVDGIANVGTGDFAAIEANADYKLYSRVPNNVFYLGINNTFPPFDNVKVRQALAIGIDKQRIVDNFYPVGSIAADQFIPPVIFGHTNSKVATYDLDAAKALMAESGVTLPIKVDLSYRDVVRVYLPQPAVVATDLQAQLKELGVEINITPMESGAFLDAASAGQLPLFMLGWGADYPDATNFVDFHFGVGSNDSFGDKDPKLTDLLTKASQLGDPAERLKLYTEVNNEIADFVPMVPIAHGGSADAFKASVKGAYAGLFAAPQFRVMETDSDQIVYEQNGEPVSFYCNDESDGETFTACEQVTDSLLGYELGGGAVVPALATEWTANEDATEWTFKLREGVKFSDGSDFDSADVYTTYAAMWDAKNPLHVGRQGLWDYMTGFFGGILNAPAS